MSRLDVILDHDEEVRHTSVETEISYRRMGHRNERAL